MQMTLRRYELPLKHRFGISRGWRDSVRSLIVELRQNDCSGYGEATENAYYGTSLDSISAELERVRSLVESTTLTPPALLAGDPLSESLSDSTATTALAAPVAQAGSSIVSESMNDPVGFYHLIENELADATFARCALDEAAWDLFGELVGCPLWKLWGLSLDNLPASSFTIGLDTPETMARRLQDSPGWPIYKIKLGSGDDLEIVRRLRSCSDAVFRVDANCAWTAAETISKSRVLAELSVEFIEQPLPADDWRGMEEVFMRSVLPVFADESCRLPDDVERCRGRFHGVNVKLMKCGGLTPAREMIIVAKRLGLSTMAGCMTESTVGISAVAQLLPLLDCVDIDGAELLAEDTARGVKLELGRAVFPHENGTGVELIAR